MNRVRCRFLCGLVCLLTLTIGWLVVSERYRMARWSERGPQSSGERVIHLRERQCLLLVPAQPRSEPMPLVIVFHGRSQRPYRFLGRDLRRWAEKERFLLALPEGILDDRDRNWDLKTDRDVRFVDEIIEQLGRDYPLDRRRIYTYGFSAGGYFSLYYAWKRAKKVAAFGMNSAGWIGYLPAQTTRRIPAIFLHGARDKIIPISAMERAATLLHEAGHKVKVLKITEGGHQFFTDHLQEVWSFFESHPLVAEQPKPGHPRG